MAWFKDKGLKKLKNALFLVFLGFVRTKQEKESFLDFVRTKQEKKKFSGLKMAWCKRK